MLCAFAVGVVGITPAFREGVEHPLALAVIVVWTPIVFLALYYLLFGLRLLGRADFPLGFRIPVGVDLFLSSAFASCWILICPFLRPTCCFSNVDLHPLSFSPQPALLGVSTAPQIPLPFSTWYAVRALAVSCVTVTWSMP